MADSKYYQNAYTKLTGAIMSDDTECFDDGIEDMTRKLALSMLDDDHGISMRTWEALMDFLQSNGEFELLGELSRMVKASNQRRYIPEERLRINL